MAINDRDYSTSEEHRPNISWGAIFAGACVAFVAQVALFSLGTAIGFTSYNPEMGDDIGRGSMIAAGVYMVFAALISLFLGGYIAARMAGFRLRSVSALHGLSSWALMSAVTIVMVGIGIGQVTGAALGIVGEGIRGAAGIGASAVGTAAQSAANNPNVDMQSIRGEIRQLLRDTGRPELNPDRLENRAQNLPEEAATAQANPGGADGGDVIANEARQLGNSLDADAVANVIAQRTGISKEDALALIGQSEAQANTAIGALQTRAREAAMRAAEVSTNAAATASWLTFITLILGGVAAFLGGLMGGPMGFGPLNSSDFARRDQAPNRNPTLKNPLSV